MSTPLFILPGLSSPSDSRYRAGYSELVNEAKRRGFEAELIYHPGQMKPDGSVEGVLGLSAAVAHARAVIGEAITDGRTPYRLLGTSFGCFVALKVAQQMAERRPERITLWGVLPFWHIWNNFCGPIEEGTRHTGSGTTILRPLQECFNEFEPLECMIGSVTGEVHVCLGSEDAYARPAFLSYLMNACPRGEGVRPSFKPVSGCPHTMSPEHEGWSRYLDAVLGNA